MEIWKDINGYEGLYQISNLGRVKSFTRKVPFIKKLGYRLTGYNKIELTGPKGRKTLAVHRLVAEAFIPNPNNLTDVNHLDGVKPNNRASNLEWCTRSHNQRHAFKTGLKISTGSRPYKLTDSQVRQIRNSSLSNSQLAKRFDVTRSWIYQIRKNNVRVL